MANDFSGDSNCIAVWRFEDSPGFTIDSQGDNDLINDGADQENSIIKEGAQSAKFIRANTDKMTITDANQDAGFPWRYDDGGGIVKDYTICFWLRLNSLPTVNSESQYVISRYSLADGRVHGVWINGVGNEVTLVMGHTNGTTREEIDFGSPCAINKWYHVGVTYKASDRSYRIRVWDDDASDFLDSDLTGTFTLATDERDVGLTIGSRDDGNRELDGYLDELVVFNSVLTIDEIDDIRTGSYSVGQTINLSASISAASNTPNAAMSVARALSAAAAASTTTPQCALNVARDLTTNIQANSITSDIILTNLIELVASIAVSIQTSAVSLPVERHLLASHSANSQTSEIALSIARDLAASISAETVTSAIELVITGLINLAATINAISQTSQPQMAVARELSAQAQAQSTSSAFIIAVLRDLSGAVAAQTQTPDINLPVLRDISTSMAGQSITSDAALSIIRAISAQISAGTDTSAAVLAVLREMQTSMNAATLTSAINLIAGGLGVITDAIIESLTTERTFKSLTPNRAMDSLSVERTFESLTPNRAMDSLSVERTIEQI